ncbi:MAG: efflux RND transporter periplasmic adaptor subunit [Bryobacteraceae bacterium]
MSIRIEEGSSSVSRWILAAALALQTACITDKPVGAANKTASAEKPRPVVLGSAKLERITRTVDATGTLAAGDRIALAMGVTGRLQEVRVDLGDRVRKGDVIARLDPADLEIAVQQATAALQQSRTRLGLPADGSSETIVETDTPGVRQANAALLEARIRQQRAKQLFEQKLIPSSDFDAAQAAFQIAEGRYQDAIEEIRNRQAQLAQRKADLAMARQQLSYAVLRAPADGAVVERLASTGQFIGANSPIAAIVTIHPLRLRLPVPERLSARVRTGQRVRIRLDKEADPQAEPHYGKVTRLSPAIDEESRTLMVEAEVPNENARLRPGAFVRAEILSETEQPALFVPAAALVTFAGIERVLTVKDGKAVERTVKTGWRDADRIEVLEGIEVGEPVILRPGNLAGGQAVIERQRSAKGSD